MKSVHVHRLEHRVATTAARLVAYATEHQTPVADLPEVRLPWYEIRSQKGATGSERDGADGPTVFIFDSIGGSLGVSAKKFAADLEAIDAPLINVRINSPGGSVFDAIAIHSTLLHHPAKIRVYVDGIAASAASVIAMGGDEVVMMPGSQMMIHDASMVDDGNAADKAKASTFLDRQSDNVAGMYQRRGGGQVAEWRELMLDETWMFADEAVKMGLADRVDNERGPIRGEPSEDLDERMRRGFDLSVYRYAGRREAPAPQRRPAGQVQREEKRMSTTAAVPRLSSDAELRHAAQLRREACVRPGQFAVAKRKAPTGIGAARMAMFPATLKAELVEYNGQRRYRVVGHASVVEVEYDMWDAFGPYKEIIDRGGFTKTLAADPDVAYLVNHRGVTMARTTNGSLLLSVDDLGLATEAYLNPKRQDVTDLVTAIEDRDITEMSFAFMLGEGGGSWNSDFSVFRIHECDLDRGDVSAVNYGANPWTDVAVRSREILAELGQLPVGAARAALEQLSRRTDVTRLAETYERDLAQTVVPAPATTAPAVPATSKGRSVAHIEALLLED